MLRSIGFLVLVKNATTWNVHVCIVCIVDYQTCVQYNGHINKYINNDLEVAHPQSGSLSPSFLVELEFGSVGL